MGKTNLTLCVLLGFILCAIIPQNSLCAQLAPAGEKPFNQDTINHVVGIENEKRTYPRYEIKNLKKPVVCEKTNNNILGLINISRGGVSLKTNGAVQMGDILPINIVYEDISIPVNVKIIYVSENIAGAEFVNLNTAGSNQLLYLSIRLDADNGKLITKLSG